MIEYAYRDGAGNLIEKDEDGELETQTDAGLTTYVDAMDPDLKTVASLHRYAAQEGYTVLSREIPDFTVAPKPLPTTIGSVIEIPSDRMGHPKPVRLVLREWLSQGERWEVLTPGHGTSRTAAQLAGATVLFEAPEVTA